MLDRHEVPTHLEVQDRIVLGLTVRQVLVLGTGLGLGYSIWEQFNPPHPLRTVDPGPSAVPTILALVVSLLPVLGGLVLAFFSLHGHTAEQWLSALIRYLTLPKAFVWRLSPWRDEDRAERALVALLDLHHQANWQTQQSADEGATTLSSAALDQIEQLLPQHVASLSASTNTDGYETPHNKQDGKAVAHAI